MIHYRRLRGSGSRCPRPLERTRPGYCGNDSTSSCAGRTRTHRSCPIGAALTRRSGPIERPARLGLGCRTSLNGVAQIVDARDARRRLRVHEVTPTGGAGRDPPDGEHRDRSAPASCVNAVSIRPRRRRRSARRRPASEACDGGLAPSRGGSCARRSRWSASRACAGTSRPRTACRRRSRRRLVYAAGCWTLATAGPWSPILRTASPARTHADRPGRRRSPFGGDARVADRPRGARQAQRRYRRRHRRGRAARVANHLRRVTPWVTRLLRRVAREERSACRPR